MPKILMLAPASTVRSRFIYETAKDDIERTSSVSHDEEVNETVDISTRIRDTLELCISVLMEKKFANALSVLPPEGPQF